MHRDKNSQARTGRGGTIVTVVVVVTGVNRMATLQYNINNSNAIVGRIGNNQLILIVIF